MLEPTAVLTQEPLNLGLVIFAPVSSVPGSASVFYLQPLLTSRVFSASGILIGAQLFLLLAQKLFRLRDVPLMSVGAQGTLQRVMIPVSELQDLLQSIAGTGGATMQQGLVHSEFLTTTTHEAPLVFAIAAYGDFSSAPFSPLIFFAVPIFTVPGVRGSLPLLILTTLTTIFVRAVVPPETTGSRPSANTERSTIQIQADDLSRMLQRFGKYFTN